MLTNNFQVESPAQTQMFDGTPGTAANMLLNSGFNPDVLRPWMSRNGKSYVTLKNGVDDNGEPVLKNIQVNNAATLRRDEWKDIDEALIRVARSRTRLWADLNRNATPYVISNGMGSTVLEYEVESDITDAETNMEGVTRTPGDRPVYLTKYLPLPITHKDFSYSLRQISTSRQRGQSLDTGTAEMAATQVIEQVERLTVGTTSYTYGGGTVYGYTNLDINIDVTITNPTTAGWVPTTLVQDILNMRKASKDAFHYGPWACYHSPNWDKFMDEDYSAAKGGNTLRDRIEQINDIDRPMLAEYMSNYDIILVQKSPNVARAVNAMDLRTVQWETHGGMMQHFKVMAIWVPQLRGDYNNNTGIIHGTV